MHLDKQNAIRYMSTVAGRQDVSNVLKVHPLNNISASLGSLLAQPSVDYMKALGVDPASVFGLQNYVCTSTSIRNFAPHVPIPGIMLPFFNCETSCCKFDIHVITLQGDIVKELHGVIDRHERVEALKWYYYTVVLDGAPIGPTMQAPYVDAPYTRVEGRLVFLCALSHVHGFACTLSRPKGGEGGS